MNTKTTECAFETAIERHLLGNGFVSAPAFPFLWAASVRTAFSNYVQVIMHNS